MGDSVAKWLSKYVLKEETGLRLITHFMPAMQKVTNSMLGLNKVYICNGLISKSCHVIHYTHSVMVGLQPNINNVCILCSYLDGTKLLVYSQQDSFIRHWHPSRVTRDS